MVNFAVGDKLLIEVEVTEKNENTFNVKFSDSFNLSYLKETYVKITKVIRGSVNIGDKFTSAWILPEFCEVVFIDGDQIVLRDNEGDLDIVNKDELLSNYSRVD